MSHTLAIVSGGIYQLVLSSSMLFALTIFELGMYPVDLYAIDAYSCTVAMLPKEEEHHEAKFDEKSNPEVPMLTSM